MKSLILAFSLLAIPAQASVGGDVLASLQCTASSIRNGQYVAPWSSLVPGQWLDPVTCATRGVKACANGSKWGRPGCF